MYLDIKVIMWFNSLRLEFKITENTTFEFFKIYMLAHIKMIMINTEEHQKLFNTTENFIDVKYVINYVKNHYLHKTPYKPSYLLYESNQKPNKIQTLIL
jgi:hypothetical protein